MNLYNNLTEKVKLFITCDGKGKSLGSNTVSFFCGRPLYWAQRTFQAITKSSWWLPHVILG